MRATSRDSAPNSSNVGSDVDLFFYLNIEMIQKTFLEKISAKLEEILNLYEDPACITNNV
jgi:hypothetical protein